MANHRTAEQLEQMRRLDAAGVCLFCPQGLREHAGQALLWESEHWVVTPNKYPYRSTSLHLLLIPHQHVGDLIDLDPAAQADFWSVLAQIRSRWDLSYYGLGVRNGDCRFTGGTIEHVHAHVLVGDAAVAEQVPVRMRFSSSVQS